MNNKVTIADCDLSRRRTVPHYARRAAQSGAPAPGSKQELAISRVTVQQWQNIYEPAKGFCAGTIFSQLDLPFCGMRGAV